MARVSRAAFGGPRPLTTSRHRKKEASMRSTALPAELGPVPAAPIMKADPFPPLAGEGGRRSRPDEGGRALARRPAATRFQAVSLRSTSLIRPSLTRGPPSPARGEGARLSIFLTRTVSQSWSWKRDSAQSGGQPAPGLLSRRPILSHAKASSCARAPYRARPTRPRSRSPSTSTVRARRTSSPASASSTTCSISSRAIR